MQVETRCLPVVPKSLPLPVIVAQLALTSITIFVTFRFHYVTSSPLNLSIVSSFTNALLIVGFEYVFKLL
jgi:hypothetical protein